MHLFFPPAESPSHTQFPSYPPHPPSFSSRGWRKQFISRTSLFSPSPYFPWAISPKLLVSSRCLWSSQVSIQLPSRTSVQRSHWRSKLDYTDRSSMSPETTSCLYFIISSTIIIQARISVISLLRHHILEVMINPPDSSSGHILLCHHCLKAGLNYLSFGFLYRFQLPSKPLSKLPTE